MQTELARELLVLRHGKSDWQAGVADFERSLAKRGRKTTKRIGKLLRERSLEPDLVVSSPAERARETARRVCRFAAVAQSSVEWEAAIYEADLDTLVETLTLLPARASRVMIVGHNPGFEALVRHLAGDSLGEWDSWNLMPTAALAHLQMPDDWSELPAGCARCVSIVRPREMGDT